MVNRHLATHLRSRLMGMSSDSAVMSSSTARRRLRCTAMGAAAAALAVATLGAPAQAAGQQIWVNPGSGNDSANGSQDAPLRTLAAAWNRIGQGGTAAAGSTINLLPGTYARNSMPYYWENRHGSTSAPLTIRAAGAARSAVLLGDLNMYDIDYLVIDGLAIAPRGDAFHCEDCGNVTIKNSTLDGRDGGSYAAHETFKANQSHDLHLLNNVIVGADDNAIDMVAVKRATITGNNISGADDWCAYTKGGSSSIDVVGNEIHDCGVGGFTAGQGTGLEFMVAPDTTYEATDVRVSGNFVHDTEGAAFGVNGGDRIQIVDNVATRVGTRSHLLEVTFGARSCDGNSTRCQQLLNSGAWGTSTPGGDVIVHIPDQDVSIQRNTIVNPSGVHSQWQHFEISTPRTNAISATLKGPATARTDTGLVITDNVIRNGSSSMPLGIDNSSVCTNSNPTCTVTQILRDNDINGSTSVAVPTRVPTGVPPLGPRPSPTQPTPKPTAKPKAPRITKLKAGRGKVKVSWSRVSTHPTVNRYRVKALPGGRTCTTTGTSCTVKKLSKGKNYRFTVTAHNAKGWSSPSKQSKKVRTKR